MMSLNLAIHDALENNVDQFIFLGDYITDGSWNNETLELIKKYGNYVIRGNRENYVLNYNPQRKLFANYKTIANTYNDLTPENLNYIKSLPEAEIITINNYKILLIHGHSFDFNNLEKSFEIVMQKYDFDICLFAHNHKHSKTIYRNRLFLNPGTIAQPADTPTYKYCIVDLSEKPTVELREFDIKNTYEELKTQYENSSYYKENLVWCKLILTGIQKGKYCIDPFLDEFNKYAENIDKNNPTEFNELWERTYKNIGGKL